MTDKMKSLSGKPTYCKATKSISKQSLFLRRKTDLPWMLIASDESVLADESQELYRRITDLQKVSDLDDSELIKIIITQNREAYQELFARYQKKLFAYIYHLIGNREETEDVLQNVFSKTYKSIAHFDTTRKFSSWIYRIAHNEAVNFLKRKGSRYSISWDDIATSKDKLESASGEEGSAEKIEHQEIAIEMNIAMQKIPLKYQEVLRMRYFQEYSYAEMGKILEKPLNTVGTLINRAKKKLLEAVKESENR